MNEPDGGAGGGFAMVGGGAGSTGGGTATGGGSATGGGLATVTREDVTLTFTAQEARHQVSHDGDSVWLFNGTSGAFAAGVESYAEYGAPTMPGMFTLRAADANYDTCGVCLIIRRGTERYMPVIGVNDVVTFTTLGKLEHEHFTGSVPAAMEFREVTINSTTYVTTDVPNGKRLLVAPWSWDAELPAPECGGHGHVHGTTCHCDSGYQVDPTNPANCVPM